MPVDRSTAGIRLPTAGQKRRRSALSTAQLNRRRPSPRPDGAAWRRNSPEDVGPPSTAADSQLAAPAQPITAPRGIARGGFDDGETLARQAFAGADIHAGASKPGRVSGDNRTAEARHHRHRAPAVAVIEEEPFWPFGEPSHPATDTAQVGRIRRRPTGGTGTGGHGSGGHGSGGHGSGGHGSGRGRPIRSLIIGGALAAAILGGTGLAAWAMEATPPVAPEITEVTDITGVTVDDPGTGGTGDSGGSGGGSAPAGSVGAGNSVDQPSNTATMTAPVQAPPTSPLSSDPPNQPANGQPPANGPATVSTLAPGDPGFGWPSSAFGSPAAP